ncbi:MAG: tRNA (adenosine(37)-N6)-threonylcarbamoyltransferase complex dimerization subunit type 1 TsaB [Actinomycetes bacterium]
MSTLIIDTATDRTSVGIYQSGVELFYQFSDGAMAHGEALPKIIAEALKVEPNISKVVIGMGPGPFTGLRVGIVFAQTFATARKIPWVGVCTLDAIALGIAEKEFIVATNARRKEIYWAKYLNGVRTIGPSVAKPEALTEYSEPKFGFGFTSELSPHPKDLLKISEERKNHLIEPMYLRNPDAVPTIDRK